MKLAIIPARGGSKRIPRKNIKYFAGKPMIGWPIDVALESGMFDRVVVSTDDEEIAEAAKLAGADVPFMRPPELSDDNTPTRPVIRHAIEMVEKEIRENVGHSCCIYATAAFIEVQDLQQGLQALQDGASFAFAASAYPHPIQRAFYEAEHGGIEMVDPEARLARTQDLRKHFHDVGMFYWGTREGFFSDTPMFSAHSRAIHIPRQRAVDIDEPEDWALAEAMFAQLRKKSM